MTRPVLAGLAVLAVLGHQAWAADASVERGRAFVERHCARCHAVGPTGDSPMAEAPRLRDLHRRYPVEQLAEALAEGILTGHPDMPQFRLEPDEIEDVIGYLKSLERS